jgi:hypothetical protein
MKHKNSVIVIRGRREPLNEENNAVIVSRDRPEP